MTTVLDGPHAKNSSNGLLSPPARSAPDVAVSDISINVQENGTELSPSKVHCDFKSGISDDLKKRVLAIKPDELAPSDRAWVTNVSEAVKLRLGESGPAANKPLTIHSMLANVVEKAPDAVALGYKKDDVWIELSYMEYFENILKTAKSFLKLGLEAGAGVGILGFNSLEWFLSYMGAVYCGGVGVGIYTTNSAESCKFVVEDSRCNVICVENAAQLKKIMQIKDQLKHLKAVVQWSGEVEVKDPMVYSWSDFQKLGEDVADDLVVGRVKMMAPNKCCSLIYTSGTTGNPKGVMISHDNLTWTGDRIVEQFKIRWLEECLITFLPLSHIAGQLLDVIIPVACGASVYFASPDALKGSLGVTLREIRPTVFFAVPRVWEKFMEKMQALGASVTGPKKAIATWAKGLGLRGNKSLMSGSNSRKGSKKRGSTPWGWTLANMLVFNKVRKNLGLDRCRYLLSGAAPLSKETHDYFLSLNLPIYEIYGMSESTGPHTFTMPDKYRSGSCGMDMTGAKTVIHEPDAEGNGEICMDGRHVFMGYLNNDEKTRETLDKEGVLHSGDIGRVDQDGFLYITGRIKELIITAGGENIAPVPIEDLVKQELPCIGNCMLIGDRRKFLSMMLALKTEVDEEGNPLDQLTKQASSWLASQGVTAATVSDIRGEEVNEAFKKAIQAGIDKVNAQSVSRAQKIQKWTILPRDFSIGGGELGPTLKLRRPIVVKMYEAEIEKFYEDC